MYNNPNWRQPEDTWLEHRLGLFERFYLSSFEGQTNKNFKCLVFCDDRHPCVTDEMKVRINAYSSDVIEPIWVDHRFKSELHNRRYKEAMKYYVKERLGEEQFVVTSRVDSDDAVAVTFVDDIQKNLPIEDKAVLLFKKGYTFSKEKAYNYDTIKSPFITFCERVQDFQTAYKHGHSSFWRNNGKERCTVLEEPRSWMWVCHDKNIGLKPHRHGASGARPHSKTNPPAGFVYATD